MFCLHYVAVSGEVTLLAAKIGGRIMVAPKSNVTFIVYLMTTCVRYLSINLNMVRVLQREGYSIGGRDAVYHSRSNGDESRFRHRDLLLQVTERSPPHQRY